VIFTALFFAVALSYVLKAHKQRPTTGREGIIGEIGIAATDIAELGTVKVHGEIWRARASLPIPKGAQIIVKSAERMQLTVEEYKAE
jgi:membrane-bound serine protease (ClpP class)